MLLFVKLVSRIFHCGTGPDTSQGRWTLKGSTQKLPPSLNCPSFIDPFSPIGTSAQSPSMIGLATASPSAPLARIDPSKTLANVLPRPRLGPNNHTVFLP